MESDSLERLVPPPENRTAYFDDSESLLLTLSSELRNSIYELVSIQPAKLSLYVTDIRQSRAGVHHTNRSALIRTCIQIRSEPLEMYYMRNNFQLVLNMNSSWGLGYSWLHCIGDNLRLIRRLDILIIYDKSTTAYGQPNRIRLTFRKVPGTETQNRLEEPAGFRDGDGGIRVWAMLKGMPRLEEDIRTVASRAGLDGMDAEDYVKVLSIVHDGLKKSMEDRRTNEDL